MWELDWVVADARRVGEGRKPGSEKGSRQLPRTASVPTLKLCEPSPFRRRPANAMGESSSTPVPARLSPCTATLSSVTTRTHALPSFPFLLRPACLTSPPSPSIPSYQIEPNITSRAWQNPPWPPPFRTHAPSSINQLIHQPSITATILSITRTCAFVWRLSRRQMNLHPRYIQLISSHPSKLKGSDIT